MSSRTIILIVGCILIGVFLFVEPHTPAEAPNPICDSETRLCPDGTSVGRTGPKCEFVACPTQTPSHNTPDNLINIDTPIANQVVTSPLTVSGKARGSWFFEGSFPIVVTDWDGVIIGQGIATAQGEWMTSEFVPFTGTISYTLPTSTPYARGTVIFKKDNPSGLPEHDAAREVGVLFSEFSAP